MYKDRRLKLLFMLYVEGPELEVIIFVVKMPALQNHAYSNILKISSPKNEIFQIKNSDIFHVSTQNIDCGYLLEPP